MKVANGQMTYRNWIEGIKAGRTVVSRNGHKEFLDLKVNNAAGPGDEIKQSGSASLPVSVKWTASQKFTGTIELVRNGVVVASKQATIPANGSVTLNATANFDKSGWLAARRTGSNGHTLHTGAVFVTVNNLPVRVSASDAQFYVDWMDNLLAKTSPGGAWNSYFPTKLAASAGPIPSGEGDLPTDRGRSWRHNAAAGRRPNENLGPAVDLHRSVADPIRKRRGL